MYKRLTLSLGTLIIAILSLITGTQALLSSNAELTTNTLSTGSVNLNVSVNGNSYTDKTNSGFTQTILPGNTASNYFWLKNNASDTNLAIAAQTVNISGTIPTEAIFVSFTAVDQSDNPISGTATVKHSITEWKTPGSLSLPVIAPNQTQKYRMDISMGTDITTSGSLSFDYVFTGTQSD
jgi:hypothetical protein